MKIKIISIFFIFFFSKLTFANDLLVSTNGIKLGDSLLKYIPYKDKATQDKFNKLVNDLRIDNSLESSIDQALREIREQSK